MIRFFILKSSIDKDSHDDTAQYKSLRNCTYFKIWCENIIKIHPGGCIHIKYDIWGIYNNCMVVSASGQKYYIFEKLEIKKISFFGSLGSEKVLTRLVMFLLWNIKNLYMNKFSHG